MFYNENNGAGLIRRDGFKPLSMLKDRDTLDGAHLVVLAWFDGEPDLWLVENAEGLSALQAKYVEEWGPGRVRYTVLQSVIQ